MKHGLASTAGLIALALVALVANPALGQTVAPGPYYALPSWDQTLPGATRFIVLSNMNSQGVLDRETGLVWQQSPDSATIFWGLAQDNCLGSASGGRKGWRLPSIQELESLVDVAMSNPALPAGNPFTLPSFAGFYWSGTTFAGDPSAARGVNIGTGSVGLAGKSSNANFWCVRGGSGTDAQ